MMFDFLKYIAEALEIEFFLVNIENIDSNSKLLFQ